jgi:hypothetical protein
MADDEWRDGHTENISRSGVLFHTDRLMPPHTRIEMLLALLAEVGGDAPAMPRMTRDLSWRQPSPATGSRIPRATIRGAFDIDGC